MTALGGGTGLSSVLRALKRERTDVTAIVTVADDGGSSGRLRRELGVLPPGDIRNCLVALADDESLMGRLFQHRFADGDLSGHSFGNLFLAALTEVTGSFDQAVEESSRVLKVNGRVVPSTLQQVRLWAERADGERVCGETLIAAGVGPCRRVWLDPEPAAHPDAVRAVEQADLVLLGPGSLFTSVLPHLAVADLAAAVRGARGIRAYVCNVMTQPGETDGLDAAAHLERVLEAVPGGVDVALVHDGPLDPAAVARYAAQGQDPVRVDRAAIEALGVRVVAADLAESDQVVRHAPARLTAALVPLAREAARSRAAGDPVPPAVPR
ncbi:MAG: YvcK family protein [Thermoleophilia bacterium]|nr:YvcK family protein [Thermoleophilia bacterium]